MKLYALGWVLLLFGLASYVGQNGPCEKGHLRILEWDPASQTCVVKPEWQYVESEEPVAEIDMAEWNEQFTR